MDNDIKIKKRKLKCPLFIVLSFSVFLFMIVGMILVYFLDYEWRWTIDHPVFAALFLDEKIISVEDTYYEGNENQEEYSLVEPVMDEVCVEEDAQIEIADANEKIDKTDILEKNEMPDETINEESSEDIIDEEEVERRKAEYIKEYGEIPFQIDGDDTWYVSWNGNKSRSVHYISASIRPVSSPYSYKNVDDKYYENSIFIGDSRIAGLHDYSGWENTTFCYKIGLNVYRMMTDTIITNTGKSTIPEVLSERQYENVYIMIGINELGIGTVEDFSNTYKENLDIIRELQPDARIILMGIMFETAEYSEADDVYNNDNINARNGAIARLANGKDIMYLDVNPAVTDESGGVRADISFDGVHLIAKYYYLWTDYMYSHGY